MKAIAAILLVIMMAGCGDNNGTIERPYTDGDVVSCLRTEKHDGHLWIIHYKGGVVHHPDCPCMKKDKDGKEKD